MVTPKNILCLLHLYRNLHRIPIRVFYKSPMTPHATHLRSHIHIGNSKTISVGLRFLVFVFRQSECKFCHLLLTLQKWHNSTYSYLGPEYVQQMDICSILIEHQIFQVGSDHPKISGLVFYIKIIKNWYQVNHTIITIQIVKIVLALIKYMVFNLRIYHT